MKENSPQSWFTLPRVLFWILIFCFVGLQIRLWIGEDSLADIWRLKGEIEQQEQENYLSEERNKRLQAEVKNLKEGLDAVEERARTQLGMVKEDETFFLIINEDQQ